MAKKFSYRMFEQGSDVLLAIADYSIRNKVMEDKERGLEVHISDFYSGEECSENEAKKLIRKATIINAMGKDIVSLLVDCGYVNKENILTIAGIPHAQIISIN